MRQANDETWYLVHGIGNNAAIFCSILNRNWIVKIWLFFDLSLLQKKPIVDNFVKRFLFIPLGPFGGWLWALFFQRILIIISFVYCVGKICVIRKISIEKKECQFLTTFFKFFLLLRVEVSLSFRNYHATILSTSPLSISIYFDLLTNWEWIYIINDRFMMTTIIKFYLCIEK